MSNTKEIWGPKVWFLIHRLAAFSDRTDIVGAWKGMLVQLNLILPCELCKKHMKAYISANPIERGFVPLGVVGNRNSIVKKQTGAEIRDGIIKWTFRFHNHVNTSRGVPPFPEDLLNDTYGQRVHVDAARDARLTLAELEVMWAGHNIRSWVASVKYLIGLVGGGTLG
jgi:hypothetical protein